MWTPCLVTVMFCGAVLCCVRHWWGRHWSFSWQILGETRRISEKHLQDSYDGAPWFIARGTSADQIESICRDILEVRAGLRLGGVRGEGRAAFGRDER